LVGGIAIGTLHAAPWVLYGNALEIDWEDWPHDRITMR
jgi:hypothetical protein